MFGGFGQQHSLITASIQSRTIISLLCILLPTNFTLTLTSNGLFIILIGGHLELYSNDFNDMIYSIESRRKKKPKFKSWRKMEESHMKTTLRWERRVILTSRNHEWQCNQIKTWWWIQWTQWMICQWWILKSTKQRFKSKFELTRKNKDNLILNEQEYLVYLMISERLKNENYE